MKTDCSACLGEKCSAQASACSKDGICSEASNDLATCVCVEGKDPEECQATFFTSGGDKAEKFINCYSLNCQDACQ